MGLSPKSGDLYLWSGFDQACTRDREGEAQACVEGAIIDCPVQLSRADGSNEANAAQTCSALHDDYPNLESGIYWIDPDGDGGTQAFQVECDMTTAGGGWTTTKKWGSGQIICRDFLTQTNPMGLVSQSQGDINESTYSIRSFGDLLSSNQVKIHWQFDTQEYVHQTEGFVFAAGPVEFNPNAENETPAGWWTGSGWRGNPDLPFQQAIREAPIAESQPVTGWLC